jgi:hypothetical protein
MKHSIPLAFVLLLAACAPAAPSGPSGSSSSAAAPLETYEDPAVGYSIDVPSDWAVEENDTVATDAYQAVGTSFSYPADRDRSALLEAKVNVARLPECPAQDGGVMEDVNGVRFMRTAFDGVGAGNRYRGQTYATERGGACVVVTLYTHSCNLGPDCGEDHAGAFSYDDVLSALRRAIDTLALR